MKKFKKIMAVLVAAVLMVAMMVPAFAAAGDYVITIKNALAGETYKAYKIFDMTDGRPTAQQNHTYKLTEDATFQADKAYFTKSTETGPDGQQLVTYIRVDPVSVGDDVTANTYYELEKYMAYTINSDGNGWYNRVAAYYTTAAGDKGLHLTPIPGTTSYSVTFDEEGFDPADFAAWLKTALDTNVVTTNLRASSPATATPDGNGTTPADPQVKIDVSSLGQGYYLVDTTLGALVALDSANKTIDMYEKNTTPSLTKKIKDTEAGEYDTSDVELNVGDRVYFEIEVTDGKGTDAPITVKDKMYAGLTLDPTSFKVKKGGVDVAASRYTIKINDDTPVTAAFNPETYPDTTDSASSFEVVFDATYVTSTLLTPSDKVVITYEAILNDDARIYNSSDTLVNENKANLNYASQNTVDQEVKAKTHAFKIKKIDKSKNTDNGLGGVQFTLTKKVAGVDYYYSTVTSNREATPVVVTGETWGTTPAYVTSSSDALTKGEILFTGLEAGTYTLTETQAASGFNPLTETLDITVNTNGTITYKVHGADGEGTTVSPTGTVAGNTLVLASFNVENTPGTALPATGGMGTTVLYIVGGMLVILAGAYLFFSRKKTA